MKTLIAILVLLGCAAQGSTTTNISSGNCNPTDIANAISAITDGDIVQLPAGSFTWTTTLAITKGITVRGAPQVSGANVTIIVYNLPPQNPSNPDGSGAAMFDCNAGAKRFTLTGITFQDAYPSRSNGIIKVSGTNWRVCTNDFVSLYYTGLNVDGDAWGLVDHCRFQTINGAGKETGIICTGDDARWAQTFKWGTTNVPVIEDCIFDFTGGSAHNAGVEGWSGCSYVIRHCMMTNANASNHGADQGNGEYRRSAMAYEAYSNTIVLTISTEPWALQTRGGASLAYGNRIINKSGSNRGSWFGIQYFRSEHPQGSGGCYNKTIAYGYMALVNGNTPNQFDGNSLSTGWPGLDQPGRAGSTVGYTASSPPTGNGHVSQGSFPLYDWNNSYTDNSGTSGTSWALSACDDGYMAQIVQANRDYFQNTQAPGYTALSYPHPMLNAGGAPAATYYIATTGNDTTGTGAIGSPWKTIEGATAKMKAGDSLFIRGGTYTEVFDIFGPNSTAANPTIIKAYPGEVPIFNSGATGSGNSINGVGGMILDGLQITGLQIGIFLQAGCSNIILRNLTIHDLGQEAIHIKQFSHDITIDNCIVHDTGQQGSFGEGLYLGTGDSSGTGVDNTHDLLVRSNTIYNTLGEGIEIKPGTYNITLDHNLIHTSNKAQVPSGAGGGAIEVNEEGTFNVWPNNPNHIIKNNTIYDTVIGIRAGNGGYYYNNVVYGCSKNGVLINNNDSDSWTRYVYHNTIDMPSGTALANNGGTTDIRNNIGPSLTGNLTVSSGYFVNSAGHDYHLVAHLAGADLTAVVPKDIDGNSRLPLPTDMGAYELGAVVGPVTLVTPSSLSWVMTAGSGSSNKTFTVKNNGSGTLSGFVRFATP